MTRESWPHVAVKLVEDGTQVETSSMFVQSVGHVVSRRCRPVVAAYATVASKYEIFISKSLSVEDCDSLMRLFQLAAAYNHFFFVASS